MKRSKSDSDETKETPAQKFFREREEKRKKREKREAKRKAREAKRKGIKDTSSNKPMPMTGFFPTNPAIYKLVNTETGEVFVSYSKNMSNGVKKHLSALRNRSHDNPDLQEDYKNIHSFHVEILREYNYYDKKIIEQDAKEYLLKVRILIVEDIIVILVVDIILMRIIQIMIQAVDWMVVVAALEYSFNFFR